MEVLDSMRENAPLVLGDAFAIDYLYVPLEEQPDLGSQPRALFRGVDVCNDPFGIHVQRRADRLLRRGLASGNIRVLVVPKETEEVEAGAFRGWARLETVVFEEGSKLSRIGENAFQGSGLSAFTAPIYLRTIGSDAFADCKRLHRLSLNEGLEEIGDRCFAKARLESVSFPERELKMGADVFRGCISVMEVRLPADASLELAKQFHGCKVTQVYVPKGAKDPQNGVFKQFISVTRVVLLGSSWRSIGEGMFEGTSLKEFVAPEGLREIMSSAFSRCRDLKRVVLNEGIVSLGSRCFQESGLLEIEIPASVRTISSEAFRGCSGLRSLTFASGSRLEAIGTRTFCGTALRSFAAPDSLLLIEPGAFSCCERLKTVQLNAFLQHLGPSDPTVNVSDYAGVF